MRISQLSTAASPAHAGGWSRRRLVRPVRAHDAILALVFLLGYLLLDWLGYIRPFHGLDITPWNPEPALAVALLVRRPQWWWLPWISLMTSDALIRGVPAGLWASLVGSGAVAASYAGMAELLRRRLDRSIFLATQRDLAWFMAIVVGGAFAGGLAYMVAFTGGGAKAEVDFLTGLMRYWVGNAVGLIVVLPMLLVVMDPRRRGALRATLGSPQWWFVALLIVVSLWGVLIHDTQDPFRYFYLVLLLLAWASSRMGIAGAVLSATLIQVGVVVAVQLGPQQDLAVFELQLRMAAVALTGLALGLAVDERERAQAELRSSLHMAAAGQMSAAIAHELSQPLTALGQYAQASRMLSDNRDMPEADRQARLAEVVQRMADEALRAGDVVKRLREFFRSGGTRLQATELDAVLRDALAAQERRAAALKVKLRLEIDPLVPAVLIDRVQIEVVLRNLLANALDAAENVPGGGEVVMRARERGGQVQVEVLDNGRGVDEKRLGTLFEPGQSDKPSGMGIGLSICRAIVEAHGGWLWAESGPGGQFCFTLEPATQDPGDPHAP